MADEKGIMDKAVDFYNGVKANIRPEVLKHRAAKWGAIGAMYGAAAGLTPTADHDKIIDTVLGAAVAYDTKLKGLPDVGETAKKYDRGRMLTYLEQRGLTQERIVDMVRTGQIDQLFMQVQQQFGRTYDAELMKYAYNAFGPKGKDRFELENKLAEGYIKASGSTQKVAEVVKGLEDIIEREVEADIQRAPPAPEAKAA